MTLHWFQQLIAEISLACDLLYSKGDLPVSIDPIPIRHSIAIVEQTMHTETRRRHVRLPLELPVKFHCPDAPPNSVEGKTRNLSDSGLMLVATEPLPPGASITLQMVCSDRKVPLSGHVVWSRRLSDQRAQTGIQFQPFPGDGFASQVFMREFLKEQ